jgi:hypothetical protein
VTRCAPPATRGAVDCVADKHDAHVIADTIAGPVPSAPSQFPGRFACVALHSAADQRLAGIHASDHIDRASSMHEMGYRVAVAGGIGPANLAAVIAARPEIVVAGRAILDSGPQAVILTRGAAVAEIYTSAGRRYSSPAVRTAAPVTTTIGAGNAALAAIIAGVLSGRAASSQAQAVASRDLSAVSWQTHLDQAMRAAAAACRSGGRQDKEPQHSERGIACRRHRM